MPDTLPLRVLIVEDDAAIHEEIKDLITSLGFQVAGDAYNGVQAVTLAKQLKPDVILIDIVMPDPESGREDNRAGLRASESIMHECPTPIVWLTAYETPQMIAEASSLGVSAYLVKPPQLNELARAITLAHARFVDMQELRRSVKEIEGLQAQLRDQALHDPLTGLYNRRYLDEITPREIARSERENNPVSILMVDIDNFKQVNDTYGHPVGDRCLVEIASLLTTHTRGSDIVCRYGGEEFILVLPDIPTDAAFKRAEELRQLCANAVILHSEYQIKITLSFGVATYPNHGSEATDVIAKADQALYISKSRGRNCVTIWNDEVIPNEPRGGDG